MGTRREFLALGAGTALLPSLSWADTAIRDELTLGWCDAAMVDEATTVVPADRLTAGDADLARHGARITVHGLGEDQRLDRLGIRALDLQVHYEVPGTDGAGVEVRAWSHQLLPVEQNGTPNAFTAPVADGLKLVLEIETPLGVERREATLVTGRESGRQKLRSGRYVIAPGGSLPRRFAAGAEALIELSVEAA